MKLKATQKTKVVLLHKQFKPLPHSYESPASSFIQCQLISTPTQLNLNLISTKLPLNLISTSFQPQVQINLSLNSTSTITSTQYGCDIKATQSCFINRLRKKILICNYQISENETTKLDMLVASICTKKTQRPPT